MTEERVDPAIAQQLIGFGYEGQREMQENSPDWIDRHWFSLLGLTLLFLWACIVWLLTLIPHNPTH
jgi:hypothetical protein